MRADGTRVRRLTRSPAIDREPSWSPDGKRLTFVSERDGNREVYTMRQDGSKVIRITDNPAEDDHPDWGPDGRIVFETRRDGQWEIHAMKSDGTGLVNLTNDAAQDQYPAWSPDGTGMIFATLCGAPGTQELHRANLDGTDDVVLTTGHQDGRPSWSPR